MEDRGGYSEFVLRPVTLAIRRWRGDPRHSRQMLGAAARTHKGTSSSSAALMDAQGKARLDRTDGSNTGPAAE